MEHSDKIILEKSIREIDFAVKKLRGTSEKDFLDDIDAQHSIGMAAINLGELIKHVSDELRDANPQIPWREAAGLRDIAAHSYDTLRMDDLYKTVKDVFPELKEALKGLLGEEK